VENYCGGARAAQTLQHDESRMSQKRALIVIN
jgi:hypothetical protein